MGGYAQDMARITKAAWASVGALGTALGVALCAGCSGGARLLEPLTGPGGERLTPADFRSEGVSGLGTASGGPGVSSVAGSSGEGPAMLDPASTPVGSPLPSNPIAAANQPTISTIEAMPGGPTLSASAPPPVESAALLDVKVGDINGLPIFASDFFAEMEERLIAESRLETRRNWTEKAAGRIGQHLDQIIAGELLRAEALENLPQQTREAGLGRLLDRERAAIQSRSGGSLAEAQRRVMQERGLTMEEYLAQFRDESLTQLSIEQIRNGIQISGRDIRNYYERNYDKYNPRPRAQFRLITVLTSNTEGTEQVRAALASGTPFEQVASASPNSFNRAVGGTVDPVEFEGEFSQASLFPAEALNNAAHTLTPGQWTGPIVYGNNGAVTAWLYLSGIDRSTQSLYDAQISIARLVRDSQTEERFMETIDRLSKRASFTARDEMVRRLLQIATQRYYPPGQPEPRDPAPSLTPGLTPGR